MTQSADKAGPGGPSSKQILLAVKELQAKLRRLEDERDEPVAVVGAACRLPGGVRDRQSLWALVERGVDAIEEIPRDRWDVDAFYDPEGKAPGKMATRWGGFVGDIDRFDARFFGVSDREAIEMDPQHRLLLELTWEALEDAGIAPERLRGEAVGVYVGICNSDYGRMGLASIDSIGAHTATGSHFNIAAGRISYTFDFRGPSVAIDTACSSSLSALDAAAKALRARECDVAIVAGVSAVVAPTQNVASTKMGLLAKDGRCKVFDARADGIVQGEGAVVVVLERASDVDKSDRRVLGLVRATAVNQDGKSAGLTAPNGESQRAVIRRALRSSRIDAKDVGYVEAHGTGTPLGDPIEMEALDDVYGADRSAPLWVGSLKANVGHLEAAAGLAGLTKILTCFEHDAIPRQAQFAEPNPRLSLNPARLDVPRETRAWPRSERRRYASLSSFGWSGTNVHVVLEEPRSTRRDADARATSERSLILLSAFDRDALRRRAGAIARALSSGSLDVQDVAIGLGRSGKLPVRASIVPGDGQQLAQALERLAAGDESGWLVDSAPVPRRGALVFSGQGSQWKAMARDLAAASTPFGRHLDEVREALRAAGGLDVGPLTLGDEEASSTEAIQQSVFAMGVALGKWLLELGVEADAVVGHSIGELSGAVVAGALSLQTAARIVVVRSKHMQACADGGAMLAVFAARSTLDDLIGRADSTIEVAIENAPESFVVGGDAAAIAKLETLAESEGVRTRRVRMRECAHTSRMEPAVSAMAVELGSVEATEEKIPFYSSTAGGRVRPESLTTQHWLDNVRKPVRFASVIESLESRGAWIAVEVSAHGVLQHALSEIQRTTNRGSVAMGVGRRNALDLSAVRSVLGAAFAHGATVAPTCELVGAKTFAAARPLPPYPFARHRYWLPAERLDRRGAIPHAGPLLGAPVDVGSSRLWQLHLSPVSVRWLEDHRVGELIVVPATAVAEMMNEALAEEVGDGAMLCELELSRALALSEEGRIVEVALTRVVGVGSDAAPSWSIALRSRSVGVRAPTPDAWTFHAKAIGRLRGPADAPIQPLAGGDAFEHRDVSAHVRSMRARGLNVGPRFCCLDGLRGSAAVAEGELEARADDAERFVLEPGLLDACLQVVFGCRDEASQPEVTCLPVRIEKLSVLRPGAKRVKCTARVVSGSLESGNCVADYDVLGEDGALVALIRGLELKAVSAFTDVPAHRPELWAWTATPIEAASASQGSERVLVLADADEVGAKWKTLLEAAGHTVAGVHVGGVPRTTDVEAWDASVIFDLRFFDATEALELAAKRARHAIVETGELVRAVDGAALEQRPRWIAVLGADATGAGWPVSRAGRGALLSLAQEQPWTRMRLVEMCEPASYEPVVREVGDRGAPPFVRLDEAGRYAMRLDRVSSLADSPRAQVRSALVTGGWGALGLETAEHLAEEGVRTLWLVGRSQPNEEAERRLGRIRRRGVRVEIRSVDLADADAVASLARDIEQVDLVVSAAGVLVDRTALNLDPDDVARTWAGKVDGAIHLSHHLESLGAKELIVFGSLAGALGNAGQMAYAAANAFIETLSERLRRDGMRATTIAWGPWSAGGMVGADPARAERARVLGYQALEARPALEAMGRARSADVGGVAIAVIDRAAFAAAQMSSGLGALLGGADVEPATAGGATFVDRVASVPDAKRARVVRELVSELVATVVKAPRERVGPDASFESLGMDSMLGLELRNRLETELGMPLPATLIWTYTSVGALADAVRGWIAEKIAPVAQAAEAVDEAPGEVHAVQAMSEAEAEAALLSELAELDETGVSS